MNYVKLPSAKHQDFLILIKKLPFRIHEFDKRYLRDAAHGGKGEGHYLPTGDFKVWSKEKIQELQDAIEAANLETTEYNFEFWGISDWDTDDDRNWDASFSFGVIQKPKTN